MKNKLTGRISTDIKITTTPSGRQVANFSVAENYNSQGKKRNKTAFYNVKAWNGVAQSIVKNLRKGDLVRFDVEVKPNSWMKDGELKDELILTVKHFDPLRQSRRQPSAQAN